MKLTGWLSVESVLWVLNIDARFVLEDAVLIIDARFGELEDEVLLITDERFCELEDEVLITDARFGAREDEVLITDVRVGVLEDTELITDPRLEDVGVIVLTLLMVLIELTLLMVLNVLVLLLSEFLDTISSSFCCEILEFVLEVGISGFGWSLTCLTVPKSQFPQSSSFSLCIKK